MKGVFVISLSILFACTSSLNTISQKKNNIVSLLQGKWILSQNSKLELIIKSDTIYHYYEGVFEKKVLFKVSDAIVSKVLNEGDVLKDSTGQYFLEEIDGVSGEVQSQYSIISYDKNTFVLSPIYSNELLTYNRKE